jgi:DNA invertase Pin-like site-specific DNA recombinase
MSDRKLVRCAVYTRKSSEEGLDQAFNSLHAQREACEAYVKSQVGEGWRVLPTIYDDGGFSGGNMERPGLARLLEDVDAGRVDTVVVYKVDRLTRSLADFAKIVDRLDATGASFVSVTQAFNTTTSMGRLTLNVLLSFAQFEREVTGERIRDKIAASKARGMWMGGTLPLGYDVPTDPLTRALVVNPAEAEIVRRIFQTYIELGSVHDLAARLEAEGVRSKQIQSQKGNVRGGCRLARGALYHMLRNRLYVGEIVHRDTAYPGNHPPIIDRDLFDAVQARLEGNRRAQRERPLRSATMLLKGKLFDVDGDPMTPSFTHKSGGKVYRYYVSAPLMQGRAVRPNPEAIRRVAAEEVEGVLERELNRRLGSESASLASLMGHVQRVHLEPDRIRIALIRAKIPRRALAETETDDREASLAWATLPIRCKLRGGRTWIQGPGGSVAALRARRDPTLVKALQQAHRIVGAIGWRPDGSLEDGRNASAPTCAYERKLCRLAFLAPDIQKQILQGRQPRDLTLDRLINARIPTSWPAQRVAFGFAEIS